jgi:hypothetical protein
MIIFPHQKFPEMAERIHLQTQQFLRHALERDGTNVGGSLNPEAGFKQGVLMCFLCAHCLLLFSVP